MEEDRKKKKHGGVILLWILGILVILAAAFIALSMDRELVIVLNGENEMNVSYGSVYIDPGAKAYWQCKVLSFVKGETDVEINGSVDTSKTGDYEVKYTADFKNQHAEASRTVTVVDDEAPVITLKKIDGHYTLPGQPYEEEGYSATDNLDGDITANVKSSEKDGVVTYTVSDAAGNETTVTRTIVYDDKVAPEIKLTGPDWAVRGGTWTGAYTASDNVDGDITGKVQVTGSVDTETEGTYELTYTVEDTYKNKTEVKRTVTVYGSDKGSQPWNEPVTGQKIVFLTFDDGPGEYTAQLLSILAQYNAKATFFVTDQFSDYENVIADESAQGHTVAVHSYSHVYSDVYSSTDAYWSDFDKMNDVIEAKTGTRSDIFRFPGGSSNTVSSEYSQGIMTELTSEANAMGLDYYDWNVDSDDSGNATTSEQVAANVIAGMQANDISVVLMHDIHDYTVNAIEEILKYGQDNGYVFMAMYKGCTTCRHEVEN